MTLCTLCRRNLLAGERFRFWRAPRAQSLGRIVCGLCEPAAARAGWRPDGRGYAHENAVGLRGTVRRVA